VLNLKLTDFMVDSSLCQLAEACWGKW